MSIESVRGFFAEKAPDIVVLESATVRFAAAGCGMPHGNRVVGGSTTRQLIAAAGTKKPRHPEG